MTRGPTDRKGTLGGSNRMLSARDVAAILGIPERTVRDKWREWAAPRLPNRKTPKMERTRRLRLDRPASRVTLRCPTPKMREGPL